MTSIFDDIKSFFSGPSVEKCSKEEKKENDKHAAKVNEENERHKVALNKIKETASCKLKPSVYSEAVNPLQQKIVSNDINLEIPQPQPLKEDSKPINMDDINLEIPLKEPQQAGGRKRRTRRPRKRSGKNTKRSR
jgi:hypothetical protein